MTGRNEHLVVFDWNGTMLADTSACLHATNTVLEKLGIAKVTRAHYQHHYTMPIAHLYHALGVDPELLNSRADEINPLWHETYSAAQIRLRRGARTMLQSLRFTPCDALILSNYVVNRIEEQARKLGVREHFRNIIAFEAGDAAFRQRGKGARLKEYLRHHPIKSGIIVGDSEEEVEIGRELGLTTVAITDGMCSTARLRAMKPDYLVRSLSQISTIAHRVFGHEAQVV
jgi:phosphoglycolate phosphatase-like HAD superfamily hydrolase